MIVIKCPFIYLSFLKTCSLIIPIIYRLAWNHTWYDKMITQDCWQSFLGDLPRIDKCKNAFVKVTAINAHFVACFIQFLPRFETFDVYKIILHFILFYFIFEFKKKIKFKIMYLIVILNVWTILRELCVRLCYKFNAIESMLDLIE